VKYDDFKPTKLITRRFAYGETSETALLISAT